MTDVKESVQGETEALTSDTFSELLQKEFKPKSERAKEEVENAVQTLAQYALKDTQLISEDTVQSIEAIIAALDEKMKAHPRSEEHTSELQSPD